MKPQSRIVSWSLVTKEGTSEAMQDFLSMFHFPLKYILHTSNSQDGTHEWFSSKLFTTDITHNPVSCVYEEPCPTSTSPTPPPPTPLLTHLGQRSSLSPECLSKQTYTAKYEHWTLYRSKLLSRLKFRERHTDKLTDTTDRNQYASDQPIYGHKSMDIKQWNAWYKPNKEIGMQRRPAIKYR